ncbi:MAG TPA: NAD(P)H-binding protein [Chitinophagaceae bacterium]|nr:NAD(P)H-binding protein [Chitinophagaceae bacterium]
MKTALVIGATGLVGKSLVKQLLLDERFQKVVVFARRTVGLQSPKLEEHLVNFDVPQTWQHLLKGDVLFSAMGTTIGKAGSKEAQYKIDFTYQYNTAKGAAENGVSTYELVSSAGASPSSKIFYSRMKGELEEAVKKLPFKRIFLIQPGILAGNRQEKRIGERIGISVLNVLHHVPGLGAYKPIDAGIVAKAMINAAFREGEKVETFTLKEVFTLAENS